MKKEFLFEAPANEAQGSVLYQEHLKLVPTSRFAPFAGYLMPLWFSSIQQEHAAVREQAGLFDCTHMGVLKISGPQAPGFLQTVTTNNVEGLVLGKAQYSYILDAKGAVLDDIIVYKRSEDTFLMVVNASNHGKIKAYFKGLLADRYLLDPARPDLLLAYKPTIADLNPSAPDGLLDIALQGPASINILASLSDHSTVELEAIKPFTFLETAISGVPCVLARTGYTGSKVGFELLVPPNRITDLWQSLLSHGESSGILACGLGARDSLRIQAGLPLYGHELAGPHDLSPFEAGYGWAVKLDKEFFIGKAAMQQRKKNQSMQVVRIQCPGGRGVRPVRQDDPVLDDQGICCGWILSSATADDQQVALAVIDKEWAAAGQTVGLYYLARSPGQARKGRAEQVTKGQAQTPDLTGKRVERFEKF